MEGEIHYLLQMALVINSEYEIAEEFNNDLQ